MDIELYAKATPQYYTGYVPGGLKPYITSDRYKTILDCGCGDGSLLYALNKAGYLKNKRVSAVDISHSRVEFVKALDIKVNACVDNAEALDTVKGDSIDLLMTTQVIEHVDDVKMVSSIERVVRRGGIVYVYTVFKMWYGWYFYRSNGRWVLDPTHLREYSSDSELLRLFDPQKFKLLKNVKRLQWFPIADFVLKRIGVNNIVRNRDSALWKFARLWRVPVLGYYEWELIFKKL